MKLIDRYVEARSLAARSMTTVRSDWPLEKDGRVDSLLSLELVAQTAAAVTEWKKQYEGGEDHFGFLAGVKNTTLLANDFQIGDSLETTVSCAHLLNSSGMLYGTFEGRVSSRDGLLAEVSVRVLAPSTGDLEQPDGLWIKSRTADYHPPEPERSPEGLAVGPADPWLPLTPITEVRGRSITARSRFPISSGWFDGHFPGRPLLPGVVMIALAGKTVGDWAAGQGRIACLKGYKKVKFKQMVFPDQEIVIVVEFRPRGEYVFEVSGQAGSLCSGVLLFAMEPGPTSSGESR